jgi:hypothetical protein
MVQQVKKALLVVGALAALAFGGAAVAGAASSSGTKATTTTTAAPAFPAHGTAAHEDAEKAVTGSAATKAQEAAVKSVGSGTAGAVTTDYDGSGYEVTVTKADGSTVEVHLDSSFTVMQAPTGHGFGG